MWYIYILKSLKDNKTYTGSTNNLERRLKDHNRGKVMSTKNRRPLKIIYTEEYPTKAEVLKREKWFKTSSGRREIKKIYQNTGA